MAGSIIKPFVVNPFSVNTYLIYDSFNNAVLIDAGFYFNYEKEKFLSFVNNNKLKINTVILTHAHVDHILGLKFLSNHFTFQLYVSYYDNYFLKNASQYANMFGFDYDGFPKNIDIKYIDSNIKIETESIELNILETPGHSPGSICIYNQKENYIFTGDTLFYESVGRADLPGGDYFKLLNSIRKNLFILPEETIVYPGHGISTTIKHEKIFNPYVKN